ncbi:hypothetical protein WKY82_10640 [Gordonia malaquae]|uniref:hypothetical protein n=1 Tax=Gordonia TaxID=2053 RepID=UPI0030C7A116
MADETTSEKVQNWVVGLNEAIFGAAYAVCAALLAGSGLVDPNSIAWLRWGLLGFGILATVLVVVAVVVRARSAKADVKLSELILREAATERHQLLDGDLSPLLQLLAEAVYAESRDKQRELAGLVRKTVTVAASNVVAPGVAQVRANLFRRSGTKMTLDPGCFSGRGDKSSRILTKDDETYQATMAGKYRLVRKVDDPNLVYQTFLTMPVSAGTGSKGVMGVLTVDSLQEGDLTKSDIPVMRVLAAIAAAAYSCERGPRRPG